jgi:hypothetical protein
MNIESTIDEAIEEAQQSGIEIVCHIWGIQNINNQWKLNNNKCCPLGAVLLKHQTIFLAEDFLYVPKCIDLRDVRFNPTHSICELFKVSPEWVYAFFHGITNSKIGYYSDDAARRLGYKYHMIFVEK